MPHILVAALLALWAPQDYPVQKGLVNDFAGVLDADSKAKVQDLCDSLLRSKKFVLVVVTVPSLQDRSVEEFTVGLANRWKIGEKKKDNGVVFLIAPADRKLRIENGYGVEGHLTDLESSHIIEQIILPRMKEGKTAEGILCGTQALAAKLGGGEIPAGLEVKKAEFNVLLIVVIVVGVIIVLCILSSVMAGSPVAWIVAIADSSSSSSSGSSSSSDSSSSGSGGGSFGGGGSSGSW